MNRDEFRLYLEKSDDEEKNSSDMETDDHETEPMVSRWNQDRHPGLPRRRQDQRADDELRLQLAQPSISDLINDYYRLYLVLEDEKYDYFANYYIFHRSTFELDNVEPFEMITSYKDHHCRQEIWTALTDKEADVSGLIQSAQNKLKLNGGDRHPEIVINDIYHATRYAINQEQWTRYRVSEVMKRPFLLQVRLESFFVVRLYRQS